MTCPAGMVSLYAWLTLAHLQLPGGELALGVGPAAADEVGTV